MAGGHETLRTDPAVDRWVLMRENTYMNFKFTNRTTRLCLIWAGLVPFGTYLWLRNSDRKYDYLGKLRGESLLRVQPQQPMLVDNEDQ